MPTVPLASCQAKERWVKSADSLEREARAPGFSVAFGLYFVEMLK